MRRADVSLSVKKDAEEKPFDVLQEVYDRDENPEENELEDELICSTLLSRHGHELLLIYWSMEREVGESDGPCGRFGWHRRYLFLVSAC